MCGTYLPDRELCFGGGGTVFRLMSECPFSIKRLLGCDDTLFGAVRAFDHGGYVFRVLYVFGFDRFRVGGVLGEQHADENNNEHDE
ncbi:MULTISPECIES: hypothetical protein [Pseudonocardia]|uniref:Uncharacterized protein n=2 Tax=Pseudonocardia TaxID=1847 RepID=A0A1Y2N764_PSEAH|nr:MULTISPECIES: hypothetical protein [Pseudonocardia]OSY42937.1 hypothetical protein BG845_01179 [Pseudonocardia autotrophica]TDN77513.1 hypothetical protein C8E95_6761 [Pseudonocardia autotrophica]BBG01538.1 hypothetical protein Pdca_27470 [Pseudonocardia autotrophica]GEC25322.1 hypothetical protein PSA01_23510 [Pseudonocardia saturnea]